MGRPKGAEGAERERSAFRTAWDVGARVRAICEFQGQHNGEWPVDEAPGALWSLLIGGIRIKHLSTNTIERILSVYHKNHNLIISLKLAWLQITAVDLTISLDVLY